MLATNSRSVIIQCSVVYTIWGAAADQRSEAVVLQTWVSSTTTELCHWGTNCSYLVMEWPADAHSATLRLTSANKNENHAFIVFCHVLPVSPGWSLELLCTYTASILLIFFFFFFKWRNSCLLEKFLIDYWTHLGRVENWVYTLQKNTSIGNVICFSNKKLTIFLCARWTRQTPNMFECCENCVRTLTADLMSDFEAAINCSLMAEVLYIFSFWRCFINKMN